MSDDVRLDLLKDAIAESDLDGQTKDALADDLKYAQEINGTAGIDAADFTPSAAAAAIATASQQRSGAATQIEMLVSALAYTMAVVELLTRHSGVDVAPAPTPEPEQPLQPKESLGGVVGKPQP